MSTEIAPIRRAETISEPERERLHSTIAARAKLSTHRRKPPITLQKIKFLDPEAA